MSTATKVLTPAQEMESELLQMQQAFIEAGSTNMALRDRYRRLHRRWVESKDQTRMAI